MTSSLTSQVGFRGRDDSELLNSGTFTYNLNTNWNQDVDTVFRLRLEVEEQNNKNEVVAGTIEWNLNGSDWWQVTTSSSGVQATTSGQFTEGDPTTDVLTVSAKTFITGAGTTDAVPNNVALQNEHTEWEYALQLIGTDLTNDDSIQIRLIGLGAYAVTPTITVVKGITPATLTMNNSTNLLNSDIASLLQNYVLTVQNTIQLLTSDQVTVSYVPAPVTLTMFDAVHILVSDKITVTARAPPLVMSDAVHILTSENIDLVQNYSIISQDSVHILTSDNVNLAQNYSIISQDSTHILTSDSVNFAQNYSATIQDSVHILTSDNIDIIQNYLIITQDSIHVLTSDNINLTQNYSISMNDSIHILTSDNITVSESAGGVTKQMMHYIRVRRR